MLNFESLRTILLGIAADPTKAFGEPTYKPDSDPRYMPIREGWDHDGWGIDVLGYVHDFNTWIYTNRCGGNTRYFGLNAMRERGSEVMFSSLTFRVVAYNAGMTYEYKFNFSKDKPKLEMREGHGVNVTGERVRFRQVPCIDLVVLDLIEKMMPPQAWVYVSTITSSATGTKPCMVCDEREIPRHHTLCSTCSSDRVGATYV